MTNETTDEHALVMLQEGLVLHRQGKLDAAREVYNKIIHHQPLHSEALHLLGVIATQTKDSQQAVEYIGKALNINPDNATAWFNHGTALNDLGRFSCAIGSYDKAIALKPLFFIAHNALGTALKNDGQPFSSIECFKKAISLQPDFIDAYINLGLVLMELNQYKNAIAIFDRALKIKPDSAEILNVRNFTLINFKQHTEIIANFFGNSKLNPEHAFSLCSCGDDLFVQKNYSAAIHCYDEALVLMPHGAEAYFGRGNVMMALKQQKKAVDSYDRAIALNPDYSAAQLSCAGALFSLGQYTAAIEVFNRLVDVPSIAANAYAGRAAALLELSQYDAGIESYDKAIAIDPNCGNYALGQRLHAKMHICDWSEFQADVQEQILKIKNGRKVSLPFNALAYIESAQLQKQIAEFYVSDMFMDNIKLSAIPKRDSDGKIKIAYFSMDFKNHPVSFLMASVFELHDRDRFEVVAFSYGANTQDEMRKRLELAFDKFIDVNEKDDNYIIELARSMKIDIAIDLTGFTGKTRSSIFASRVAPVQVNYIGYPGTMGAKYMDYMIADLHLIPTNCRINYSEKIAYLPVFQANDNKRKISEKISTRQSVGLPQTGFVFCCFNSNYKITPQTFDGWMRILHRVEGSVLLLLSKSDLSRQNLLNEAQKRRIDTNRLIFAGTLPTDEYLARYRVADLFLDTFPFNAGTTASDALWAGLPVLTRAGDAFASRMASSLLLAIGLPELIAKDQAAYEDLAVELATFPERMSAIRSKLQCHRQTQPLFNTNLFTKHLESAYVQMFERNQVGKEPDHLFVEPMSQV